MAELKYEVQLYLKSGRSRMVVMVDQDKKLKPGLQVTLKDSEDPTQWWEIVTMSQPMLSSRIHVKWNNNI